MSCNKKSLKINEGKSEATSRRRTYNKMVKNTIKHYTENYRATRNPLISGMNSGAQKG